MRKRLYLITILAIMCAGIANAALRESRHVAGPGLGIPYGGLGVNYEYQKSSVVAPFLGAGITPYDLGWSIGCRVYYPGTHGRLRGRLSALYGTTTILT